MITAALIFAAGSSVLFIRLGESWEDKGIGVVGLILSTASLCKLYF